MATSGCLNQGLVELYVSCEEALQQDDTKPWRSDEAHSECMDIRSLASIGHRQGAVVFYAEPSPRFL
jgi:hypothetical protein